MVGDAAAEIRREGGGSRRARVKDGLTVAVFRHDESRAGKPLLRERWGTSAIRSFGAGTGTVTQPGDQRPCGMR
ncbi:hypothetical protein Shyhy01_20030 [Streptomyces hygroscopicus subsp. hygroscopicus]|uniref:hypothetical protein n=1 Tax=Streptomyces sp. KHY 26 TaxID=3097359 RepID=UPI0024A385B5|nr:hypothetical protein [Streptomyces hygroscopicus]GLX49053.1 hypothetical protein Shyhy01_20030 [Streptomyces hygroscopicus subsp. hygroscopicus]